MAKASRKKFRLRNTTKDAVSGETVTLILRSTQDETIELAASAEAAEQLGNEATWLAASAYQQLSSALHDPTDGRIPYAVPITVKNARAVPSLDGAKVALILESEATYRLVWGLSPDEARFVATLLTQAADEAAAKPRHQA